MRSGLDSVLDLRRRGQQLSVQLQELRAISNPVPISRVGVRVGAKEGRRLRDEARTLELSQYSYGDDEPAAEHSEAPPSARTRGSATEERRQALKRTSPASHGPASSR